MRTQVPLIIQFVQMIVIGLILVRATHTSPSVCLGLDYSWRAQPPAAGASFLT